MQRSKWHGVVFVVVLALIGAAGAWAQNGEVRIANPGFEDGATGWSLPPNYSVVTDEAHSGKASLKVVNTDEAVYQLASQEIKFDWDNMYHFSVWVKSKGVKGPESGATICVEYYDASGGYLGGSYPTGITGDSDWALIEGEINPMPPKTAKVTLDLYLRKGMVGTAWFDDVSIKTYYGAALDCAMVKPAYRGTLDAGERDQEILVYAKVAHRVAGGHTEKDLKLRCKVLSGERIVIEKSLQPRAGVNEIRLSAARLAVGEYQIVTELLDPSGSVIDTRKLDLRKLAPGTRKPTVYIDQHGRTIRNGKPFFPLGLYFGPSPSKDGSYKEHIDRVSSSPFNTIMPYGINSDSLQTIKEYLDYLNTKDVAILYSLKDILKGIAYYQEDLLGLGDEKGQINGLVTAFRDHPALLGWYLNDEAPPKFQDRLMERYRIVKKLDPNHPTWSVLCDPGSLFPYLETADVLGTDPYPMHRTSVKMAADWAEATVGVSGGRRGVWMVPQIFDWNCYGPEKTGGAPTLDEMIVMSYLCLIEGAKGMVYYSYFDLQRDVLGFDKRWQDVMVMGREMQQLIPAALSLKEPHNLTIKAEPSVRRKLMADDSGKTYVLLANTSDKAANVSISIPSGKKVSILKHAETEDVTPSVVGGSLQVTLRPVEAATVTVGR